MWTWSGYWRQLWFWRRTVNCKTLKTFELSFLASFCEKVFICEVPTSNFFSCYYTVMFVDFYNTNTNGQKQRDTGWSKHLRYSWIQFTVFVFHFLVQINKSHCLATCISFLAWTGARAWTTKIFYGQPNQVLWLPQRQLDIKVNFEPWRPRHWLMHYMINPNPYESSVFSLYVFPQKICKVLWRLQNWKTVKPYLSG